MRRASDHTATSGRLLHLGWGKHSVHSDHLIRPAASAGLLCFARAWQHHLAVRQAAAAGSQQGDVSALHCWVVLHVAITVAVTLPSTATLDTLDSVWTGWGCGTLAPQRLLLDTHSRRCRWGPGRTPSTVVALFCSNVCMEAHPSGCACPDTAAAAPVHLLVTGLCSARPGADVRCFDSRSTCKAG